MIECRPAEGERLRDACAETGVPFRKGVFAYRAVESGEYAGCCVVSRDGDRAAFCLRTNGVDYIYDGLLRSALNLAWKQGVRRAVLTGEVDRALAGRLGFCERDGVFSADVKEDMFFTGGCSGCGGPKAGK